MLTPSDLVDAVDALVPDLLEIRRDLHAHPELSWQEHRTTDVVARHLDKLGLTCSPLGATGLVAEVGSGPGPVVALRADLDALPVEDTTTDPWRSTVAGVAHACGHDVHTTALLGAAGALATLDDARALPFRVRLVFQPAEEVMPGGALSSLAAGALTGVSRVFALHCDPALDVGTIGLREGSLTGAADMITVTLAGRGGHTSRPHLTQDLTFALATLCTQLPAALSRRVDPRAGASLVWGSINAGSAPNVIPSSGQVRGTLRMLDAAAWHDAEHLVRALVREIVAPYGVDADVAYTRGVPPVVNDVESTELLRDAVAAALGPSAVTTTTQSLGGEDFAWFVESVPGAMGRLGTRTPGGPTYDLHQGNLRVDERAVAVGAKVLAMSALASATV
ncbi:amidohydrolase [Mumia flava]|uniref:Amidohydrolase n=1 Tax=Mumia flava TaxID=1348852 RepID=A0A0B2BI90_9ACTN|nr:amidohydrolase [Mumia flava]PJJ58467.1 amidohydrolase [Mumia flava]